MGVWMIIYGFLDRIRIFRSSINGILALFIAFSMIPLGIFVIIVSLLFSVMGVWSVIMFVGLFFAGTYLYSKGLVGAWRGVYGGYGKAISAQNNLIARYESNVAELNEEMRQAQAVTGKYHGKSPTEITNIMQNDIGPRLIAAKKKLDAAKARKEFLQQEEKRVKKTFDLEAKT